MNANGAKRLLDPALSPATGVIAKPVNDEQSFLLHHLLKEALYARNRELNKLHRIHDLMFSPELRPSSEAPAWERPHNGAAVEAHGTPPHHRQNLHAVNGRYIPAVERHSLASLELKTILDVLLERLHLFVPYRAALLRLGDGTKKRPLETVACRTCRADADDRGTEHNYELLVDAAFQSQSALTMANGGQKHADSFRLAVDDSIHWYLSIPALAGRKMLGTLSIYLQADGSLPHRKMELLDILAAQTAKVIQTSLIYDRAQKHLANHGEAGYRTGLQKLLNHSGKIHSPMVRKKIRAYQEKQWAPYSRVNI